MMDTQTNGTNGVKSDWFARPTHYMRAGRGKEGYDQRLWAHSMQRAVELREPILALEADLLRQWYEAGGKENLSVSFKFSNEYIFKAGVTHKNKQSYLSRLEKEGWIQVQRAKNKEPLVRLLKYF